MRILHTVEFYHPNTGGAQLVVRELSERLARRGHDVTVATSADPARTDGTLNGVRILSFRIAGNDARGIHGPDVKNYRAMLNSRQFDVAMHYAAQQWATDLALRELTRTRRLRVNVLAPCGYSGLCDARTVRWKEYRRYFRRTLPSKLGLFDAVVYHSARLHDYEYGGLLGLTNGVVIPNGVDLAEFDSPPAVDFRESYGVRTRYMGLCVANYLPGKGQETVIEAVRAMGRSDFTMVFIGREGDRLPMLRERAVGLPVLLLSDIPRSHTVASYLTADVFVFGSTIEASPLVILEAKAARIPFVSTPCGNVAEWTGGIVCDPARIGSEVTRILDDQTLRRRLGAEGRREVDERLGWEVVTDAYEGLYARLVRERQRLTTEAGVRSAVASNGLQRLLRMLPPRP